MRFVALILVGIACFGIGYNLPGEVTTSYHIVPDNSNDLQHYISNKTAAVSFSASTNHTEKEYLDFDGAKLREQENSFDRALLQRYLHMSCVHNAPSIQFVGDDTGGWDKCKDYKEITCDVMYDMFEDGFIPNRWQITFIYDKFSSSGRLKELSEWMKKWDEVKKDGN